MIKFKKITATLLTAAMLIGVTPVFAKIGGDERHTQIPSWTVRIRDAEAGAYIDKSEGVLGKASLKLVNNTERWQLNQYVNAYSTVTVKAGKNYILEFDCRAESATMADAHFSMGNRISLIPGAASHDWTKFKTSYRPAADGTVDVGFIADNKCTGIWVDNIIFYEENTPDVNLISNGDFENGTGPVEPGLVVEEEKTEETVVEEKKESMYADIRTITVDGNIDDWSGIPEVAMPKRTAIIPDFLNEISSTIRFAYDNDNLYFMMDVIDKYYHAPETTQYWTVDGIQFGIAKLVKGKPALIERGGFMYDNGMGIYQNNTDFTMQVKREGDHNYYEVAVPWVKHFGNAIPDTIYFDALYNNNDGMGRAYFYEITHGLADGKNPLMFNYLHMRKQINGVAYSFAAPGSINLGATADMLIDLANQSNETKTVDVTVEKLDFKQSVTIPAGEQVHMEVPIKAEEKKDMSFEIKFASGGEEVIATHAMKLEVVYNHDMFLELKAETEAHIAELKELIGQCESKGMRLDYEIASYSIICEFLKYMENEAKNDYYLGMYEFEKAFTKAYEETKASLNAYLAGEKTPVSVPKYQTGDIRLDGTSIYGNVEIDGKIEERPIFFVGYGFWESVLNAMPLFSNIGLNTIAIDLAFDKFFCEVPKWERFNKFDCWREFAITDEESYSGNHSFKVWSQDGYKMNFYSALTQKVKVKPNTTYRYGLKAKGKGLVISDTGSVYLSVHGLAVNDRSQLNNSSDWESYDFTYTTGSDETELDLWINTQNNVEALYVDDVYVIEEGTNKNLVGNSSFEEGTENMTELDKMASELGMYINYDNVKLFDELLAKAEQHNVQIEVMASTHFVPVLLKRNFPEMFEAGKLFIPYAIDDVNMRKAIEIFATLTAQTTKKYDSVHAISVTNEPVLNSNEHEHYLPHWHAYLKNLYDNDINKLNEQYGLSGEEAHKTFEEIPMPTGLQGTPVFNDYRNFNDAMLLEFHSWYIDVVKKVDPDVWCYTKIMQYFRPNYGGYFMKGTNYEQHAEIIDVNGNDGWNPYGNDQNTFSAKMGWYDMMTSIKEAPVYDSEDHVTPDGADLTHDDMEHKHVGATVWDGAVHGRGLSILWVWDYRNNIMDWWSTSKVANANVVQKPGQAFEVSKTVMDINRLSREITAVQKAPKQVGLLYSRIGVTYNNGYTLKACNAYEDAIFNGTKIHFVTDSRPEDMHNYELLIVPEATNIPLNMFNEIKKYVDNGGEVLILGEKRSFVANEYNKPYDTAVVDYIYSKADTTSSVSDKIRDMKLAKLVLIDTARGKQVEEVEWAIGEYNGKIIANVLNYSNSAEVTVKLVYNGEEVKEFTELRSGENYNGEITLKPLEPILLQF